MGLCLYMFPVSLKDFSGVFNLLGKFAHGLELSPQNLVMTHTLAVTLAQNHCSVQDIPTKQIHIDFNFE